MRNLHRFGLTAAMLIVLSAVSFASRLTEEQVPQAADRRINTTEKRIDVSPGSVLGGFPGPPSIIVVDRQEVEGVLGKEVRSIADENMGRIIEVVVDRAGQVRAAVIDFGGFLGVGSRKIAVDWNTLRFAATGQARGPITLEVGFTTVNGELKVGSAEVQVTVTTAVGTTKSVAIFVLLEG